MAEAQSNSSPWQADLWKDEEVELNGQVDLNGHNLNGQGMVEMFQPLTMVLSGQSDSPTSRNSSKDPMVRQVTPFAEEEAVQASASIFMGKFQDVMRISEASSFSPSSEAVAPRVRIRVSEVSQTLTDGTGSGLGLSPTASSPAEFTRTNVHDVWRAESDALRARKKTSDRGNLNSISSRSYSRLTRRHDLKSRLQGGLSGFVMRPDSFLCVLWDIICGIMMLHDSVMIPLLTAFDVQQTGAVYGFALVSAVVWCLDMNISFFRGFINARTGFVEMRMRPIARRYLTGWFLPDVALISLDMVSFFSTESSNMESFTLLRLFRNLRLLRLVRMVGRAGVLKEHLETFEIMEWASVYVETTLGMMKHLAIIALMCHFCGCAWYALGRTEQELPGQTSWITLHAGTRDELGLPTDLMYMYSTSLHWALTQFTPAAMEVSASNGVERIFTVCVVLTGLIAFSFFLGSINQSLSQLKARSAQETFQNMLVRRYISERQLSMELAADMLAFIRQRGLGKAKSKVVFSDIKALDSLPRELLAHLQHEVGLPILDTHAMLKHLSVLGSKEMTRLCEKALKESRRIYGEHLFEAGGGGEKMYFILSGRFHYTSELLLDVTHEVSKGMRCSEASLWLSWEHHGTMTCADHTSYLFQLDGANFRKIMVRSDQAELCAMYARLFHKGLMEAYITEEEASDLFGSDEDVAQIMTPIRAVIRTSNLMADFGHFSAVWAFQVWKEWLQEQKDERRRSKRNNFNFCGRREVS